MKRLIDLQKGDIVYLYDKTKNIVDLYEVEVIHELSTSSFSTIRRVIIRKNFDDLSRLKFYFYTDTDECEMSHVDEVTDYYDSYLEKIVYIDKDEIVDELQRKLLSIKEQIEKITHVPHNLC